MSTEEPELPSETFCILPWMHLSTRPDGSMRVCCTANASSATNDKEHGGRVGIVKAEDGKPLNLNISDFIVVGTTVTCAVFVKWTLTVKTKLSKVLQRRRSGHRSKRQWETEYWMRDGIDPFKLVEETYEDGSTDAKLAYIDIRMAQNVNLVVLCVHHMTQVVGSKTGTKSIRFKTQH